jgi:hypothetical protein
MFVLRRTASLAASLLSLSESTIALADSLPALAVFSVKLFEISAYLYLPVGEHAIARSYSIVSRTNAS